MNVVNDVVIVNPVIEYLPYILTMAGILLLVWGALGGRKKPQPVKPAEPEKKTATNPVQSTVAGWKCGFCGADNAFGDKFCKVCGRSPAKSTASGWRCGFCDIGNPPEEKFCKGCGRSQR